MFDDIIKNSIIGEIRKAIEFLIESYSSEPKDNTTADHFKSTLSLYMNNLVEQGRIAEYYIIVVLGYPDYDDHVIVDIRIDDYSQFETIDIKWP